MNTSMRNRTKLIPLTKGKFAIVDAADFEWLNQWKWQYCEGYAKRHTYPEHKTIPMHSLLLETPDGLLPDHKDGNGLNNRRNNLRPATYQQNTWNRKAVTGSNSKYKGVSFSAKGNHYKAYIKTNEKQKHLGCYASEDDAARAYNKAAKALHGEFAKLNPVDGEPGPRLIHPTQHEWHKSKGAA